MATTHRLTMLSARIFKAYVLHVESQETLQKEGSSRSRQEQLDYDDCNPCSRLVLLLPPATLDLFCKRQQRGRN